MPNAIIRINRVDNNIDEVLIYREDPYLNRAVYAKRGVFAAGEASDEQIAELEQQSSAALAKERADVLAQEAAVSKAATEELEASNEEA